jgi:hypothetical protein
VRSDECGVCGRPEDEHHDFAPIVRPDGCVCDVESWGNPFDIPTPCGSYRGDADEYCINCEHNQACHAAPSAQPEDPR